MIQSDVFRRTAIRTATAASLFFALAALADENPTVARLNGRLAKGDLRQAALDMEQALSADSGNDAARFGLGAVRFFQTVEGLGQALYQFGVGNDFPRSIRNLAGGAGVPFLRLPVAANPNPEKVTKERLRQTLQNVIDGLAKVDATLAGVKSADVKLPLHFGMIRLDLDGNGRADDAEALWRIFAAMNRGARLQESDATEFVICLDRGDVDWLRGYCHLLSALAEMILAYDAGEMFDVAAPLFFPNVDSPIASLRFHSNEPIVDQVADAIAILHNFRARVKEPKRLEKALGHLRSTFALSRSSWQWILAETDDDREWLPNPKQKGIFPGVQVTAEMIDAWLKMINEVDAILDGKSLIPHWRIRDGRGINLNKVFTKPEPFDFIMWIHGLGAAPFLEEGKLTEKGVWQQLAPVFQGQFIGFAFWFN